MTFEELAKVKSGTVLKRWEHLGIPCLVVRGPGALCAYVGIPKDHPLADVHYDEVPLRVHGGLTFGSFGSKEEIWDPKYYWLGWDYAHAGDRFLFRLEPEYVNIYRELELSYLEKNDHGWVPEEVIPEVEDAAAQLQEYLRKYSRTTTKGILWELRKYLQKLQDSWRNLRWS